VARELSKCLYKKELIKLLVFFVNHKWKAFAKASIRFESNLPLAGAQRKTIITTTSFQWFLKVSDIEELVGEFVCIRINLFTVFCCV
jgi:hypothetical protein